MKTFSIRPITKLDEPFLWEMLYESLFIPEGCSAFPKEIIHEPFLSKYVEGWGREGDIGFIAVNDEEQPVGSITCRFFDHRNKGFGYISDDVPELGMALLPVYRGNRIGTSLMERLFEELYALGVERISLSVDPANISAMKLYKRFGFTEAGMVDTSVTMVADVKKVRKEWITEVVFETAELKVRKLIQSDEQLLLKWLSDPEVLQYYEGRDRPHNIEMVRDSFFVEDEETRCIFEYKGKPIGYIQFYMLDEAAQGYYGLIYSDEKIFGMDQFIGEPAYWNQGIGQLLVKATVDYIMNELIADKVVMDPQAWNIRAISCYEKCGFKKKKLLIEHESHEGQLRDCWLIEYTK